MQAADDHEAESEALPEDKQFVKGTPAKSGLTEDMRQRADRIRTEAYQIETDNMSNWHAEIEAGKVRRKQLSLADQFLTGPTYRGYEVAIILLWIIKKNCFDGAKRSQN